MEMGNNKTIDQYLRDTAMAFTSSALERTAPWLKEWAAGERELPHDPTTGIVYDDHTGMYLDIVASRNNWKDPRWLTAKEVEKAGLSLKTMERPIMVSFASPYLERKDGKREDAVARVAMYNAEQIKNIRPYEYGRVTQRMDAARANMIANSGNSYMRAGETTAMYFQEKSATNPEYNGELLQHVARYRLAITLGIAYRPPEAEIIKEVSTKLGTMRPEAANKMMYNAATYARRVVNKDFYFQRKEENQFSYTVDAELKRAKGKVHEREALRGR